MTTTPADAAHTPTLPPPPAVAPRVLPTGIWLQVYLDKVQGSRDQQDVALVRAAQLYGRCVTGLVVHGFVPATGNANGAVNPARVLAWAQRLRAVGSQLALAWGLSADGDYPRDRYRGGYMATCAGVPGVRFTAIDAEGKFEDDATDKQSAREMGAAFRRVAPDAVVIDQPWMLPTKHWSGFPYEELAAWIDASAPQFYYGAYARQLGRDRVRVMRPRFAAAWDRLEARLGPRARPRRVTLEGYGWGDRFADHVTEMLARPLTLLWCEPWPDDATHRALLVVAELARRGFTGPDAVARFQASVALGADGIVGKDTLAALGLAAPSQPSGR